MSEIVKQKTLVDITKEMIELSASITSCAIENNGEIEPELFDLLESNKSEMAVKIEKYTILIDQIENQAEFFANRAKNLKNVSDSLKSKSEYLKSKIKEAMEAAGKERLDGIETYYKFCKAPKSLFVMRESQIPSEFKIVTETIDKTKLKEALKNGKEVEGATLVQNLYLKKYNKGL